MQDTEVRGLCIRKEPSLPDEIYVLLLGIQGVGKNRLVSRLLFYREDFEKDPCDGDSGYYRVMKQIEDRKMLIELHCHHIDEEYPAMMEQLVRKTDLLVSIYNTGTLESFEAIRTANKKNMERRQQRPWKGGLVVALTDDRSDSENAVGPELGRQFADELGVDFCEFSLRKGTGCSPGDFEPMIKSILSRIESAV